MGELFGSSVKSLLQQDPPPVPNEAELLDAVVQKVGPFADRDKLCYHIRISAGKVHWAVNSSCFRFFPYADVQLWLQDDEAQQRWDQARAAAGRSSGRRGAGGGAAAAGSGSEQQGGREAGDDAADVAQADAAAAAAGFPRYTYEL
ncbi:hypothetical protein OEZ86_002450 [Tetradesmus obliquus]|nr:hypothetical protein OEZ86_002450 [Tetradesmus obliquus]